MLLSKLKKPAIGLALLLVVAEAYLQASSTSYAPDPYLSYPNKLPGKLKYQLNSEQIIVIGDSSLNPYPYTDNYLTGDKIVYYWQDNASFASLNSWAIKLLKYKPKMVIIFSGNNFKEQKEKYFKVKGQYLWAHKALSHFQIFHHLRNYLSPKTSSSNQLTNVQLHQTWLVKQTSTAYEKNNTPLWFLIPQRNVTGWTPSNPKPPQVGSYKSFNQGLDFLNKANYKKAKVKFTYALQDNPQNALIHYYLAKSLQKLNENLLAKKHFLLALKFDKSSIRPNPSLTDSFRAAERSFKNVKLIDLQDIISESQLEDSFFDHKNLDIFATGVLQEKIISLIKEIYPGIEIKNGELLLDLNFKRKLFDHLVKYKQTSLIHSNFHINEIKDFALEDNLKSKNDLLNINKKDELIKIFYRK